MTDSQTHTLLGAYVCDALDPAERAAFEQHTLECAACRQEVEELREVTGALGGAVSATPPASLRAAVEAAITATPQLPRDVVPITAARGRRRGGRRAVFVGWAAAAALACAVAVMSVIDATQRSRISTLDAQATSLSSLLSAPDVASSAGSVDTGGTATLVDSRRRDEAAITLTGLARLPAGKAYQLWIIGPGGTRSAGVVSTGGAAGPVFVHGIGGMRSFALTVEPAQGSAQPTTPQLVTLPVTG